jgi:hypothetical protein
MLHEHGITAWSDLLAAAQGLDVGPALKPAYAFRGQPDSSYPLKPSLLRYLNRLNVSETEALELEKDAWMRFVAQSHIHLSPNLYSTLEGTMMTWWPVMQHHGAPTRLLDWTDSIYVAAYFAVAQNPDKDGTIWVLHTNALETQMKRLYGPLKEPLSDVDFASTFLSSNSALRIVFVRRNTQTDRMIAQQGLFTVCTNIKGDHGEIVADALPPSSPKGGAWFSKMIIPAKLKVEVLRKLRAMNIAAHSLFPGIDGIGRGIAEMLILGNSCLAGVDTPTDVAMTPDAQAVQGPS